MSKAGKTILDGLKDITRFLRGEKVNMRMYHFDPVDGESHISIRVRQQMPDGSSIRVFVFWDEAAWVAQGLEEDIGAQGSSMDEALRLFNLTWEAEHSIDQEIPPAPQKYFDRWEKLGMFA